MPEGCPKKTSGPAHGNHPVVRRISVRHPAFRRDALRRSARWLRAGPVLGWLGFFSLAGLHADIAGPSPALIPSSHLTDAQDRMMTGQLSPAAEAKSRANALYAQAMLLLENPAGNPQEALAQLRQVVALDPHDADASVKIANILLQSGQLDPALEQLQTAAAANPHSVSIEAALGFTQRLRGQNDEALRFSTDALTRDTSQSVAMRVLLEIAGDQNDLAGGVIHIEDILKTGAPNVPASAWLTLARLYTEVAQSDAQPPTGDTRLRTLLPIYQQAAAKPPPDVETLTLLSDTYRDLGRKYDALKTLQEVSALEPSNVDIILRCADLESSLDQKTEALRDYEEAYALNPDLSGLRETLGGLYLDNGRFEDAARVLQEALADAPDDPDVAISLGIAYDGSHHLEQAQACFLPVFASPSCPPEAYLKLAVFQLASEQFKEAASTLAAAQKRFPKSARVRFYQAIQYRYEKNYAAALDCLTQMRTLASGPETGALNPDYYLESALTLNLAGQKDRIEPVLSEGLAKYPDNPDLMNGLAYFWAEQGTHLPEALVLSSRAVQLEPDNGPIQDTRGWVYFQMGAAKDALPYLQRAAFMTNNDPVVLQHVGDAYLKLGLRREAIATWYRALEKDPRNGDLANRIDAALAQAKNAHLRSAPTP